MPQKPCSWTVWKHVVSLGSWVTPVLAFAFSYLGCLLGLKPLAALAFAVIWLAVAFISRYSSLASLTASALTPLVLWTMGETRMALVFVLLAALLWWKHAENIRRLVARTEGRIGQKA